MIDIAATCAPKSDQLNADDLISGPRTITITAVKLAAEDQPVAIHFTGDDGKPWKPCKSMRRVLMRAWGADGAQYVGKSATLFLEPGVRFGGAEVGGIRISHLSHIDKALTMALTVTRASKKAYTVKPLAIAETVAESTPEVDQAWLDNIQSAGSIDDLKATFKAAWKVARNPVEKGAFKAAYDNRTEAINGADALKDRVRAKKPSAPAPSADTGDDALRDLEQQTCAPTITFAEVAGKINVAANDDSLAEAADLIQHVGSITQRDELAAIYKARARAIRGE